MATIQVWLQEAGWQAAKPPAEQPALRRRPGARSGVRMYRLRAAALKVVVALTSVGLSTIDSSLSVRAAESGFAFTQQADRIAITHAGHPIATFVFQDSAILRPYFANLAAPGGNQVTRRHPPVAGQDATDHDTMHPGVWLAFGDVSGQDFWRNKGRIEHVRFTEPPAVSQGRLSFANECRLLAIDGQPLCSLTNRFTVLARTQAWLLVWDATFRSDNRDVVFGDQEEMGLGVRVATGITEKNGGAISSSTGERTAARTWGRMYDWCDYSGVVDGERVGVILMPDPANFRPSWFHNRDYGLMVANPFGRQAFAQGPPSRVVVKRGETLRLRFGVLLHSAALDHVMDLAARYRDFVNQMQE